MTTQTRPDHWVHGTEWGWRQHIERDEVPCDPCRSAIKAAWDKRLKERRAKPIPEGLRHGEYVRRNYGCECNTCISDSRRVRRERKRRARAKKEAS